MSDIHTGTVPPSATPESAPVLVSQLGELGSAGKPRTDWRNLELVDHGTNGPKLVFMPSGMAAQALRSADQVAGSSVFRVTRVPAQAIRSDTVGAAVANVIVAFPDLVASA